VDLAFPAAAALHAVFRQWRLEGDAAAEDPCGKGAWSGSFAVKASVGCDCSSGVECRITQLYAVFVFPPVCC